MFNKESKVQRLRREGDSIINMFSKVAENLELLNIQIEEEEERNIKEQGRLMEEKAELMNQRNRNSRIVENIDKFING